MYIPKATKKWKVSMWAKIKHQGVAKTDAVLKTDAIFHKSFDQCDL